MGVTSFLLLSCVGFAITVEAQNCQRPTPGPDMSLKGSDILLENFPDGTTVSFVCNPGYESAGGSSTITCTAGSWSLLRLTCRKKNCGSAGEVTNGQIDYPEGTEFGAKIYITCNPGYNLVGNKVITCGVQGEWMGRLPECEVMTCDPPPRIENGTFSPVEDMYDYGAAVQYSCLKDYTLIGTQTISCSEDGTFQPAPPTCRKVQCPLLEIPNAEWISGSRPPFGFSATVTYRCLSGYTMTGSGTLSCGQDNEWTPQPPKCIRITTTTKATTTTTTTTKGTTTTTKGTTVATTKVTTKMTSATKPPSTKTPKNTLNPTSAPGNGGGTKLPWIFGSLGVLAVGGLIGFIVYKKKRSQRDHDKVATTETVQL